MIRHDSIGQKQPEPCSLSGRFRAEERIEDAINVRARYTGAIVSHRDFYPLLPSDLTRIPTESEVRVLEVTFAEGTRAVIPRTNIEVIEGA